MSQEIGTRKLRVRKSAVCCSDLLEPVCRRRGVSRFFRVRAAIAIGWLALSLPVFPASGQPQEPAGELEMPSRWRAFYPIAGTGGTLPEAVLRSLPEQLKIGGRVHHARTVTPENGQYDFEMELREEAYVFLPLKAGSAQTVSLGFGADWWLQVWVNGKKILDTTPKGNISWPPTIADYRVKADLLEGENVLAVRLISGKGSSILAIGGPQELRAGRFPSIVHAEDQEDFPKPPDIPENEMFSETRYVDVDGSDDNSGVRNRPWKSVQHAVDRAAPGAIIQLGPGVFHERILIRRSGKENAPIMIQGSRDSQGRRLSRIDAGEKVDPKTWTPAPEVGPKVYKNAALPYEPQIVTVAGRFLAHVQRSHDGTAFPFAKPMQIIAWPDDYRLSERNLLVTRRIGQGFRFWDALGGLYVHHPDEKKGITYLRLTESAGETDPCKRDDIAVSDGGATITLHNVEHVVLRGLEVTQGNTGIRILGEGARHNLVEDCFITHGRTRVEVASRASLTTIRDSHLAMGFFGAKPGSHARGRHMDTAAKEFLYRFFKYAHGTRAISDDRAVLVGGDATDITIEGCHLDGGLIGVSSSSNQGLTVRNNTIHGFSSVGVVVNAGTIDARIHDNLIHDCNINIRLHQLNSPGAHGHRAYIYRNRLFQWEGRGGRHFFSHGMPGVEQHPDPEIFIYHNTLVGGGPSFNLNPRIGPTPKIHFVNNVIATARHPFIASKELAQNTDGLGLFAYNWLGGPFRIRNLPAWFGEGNIIERVKSPWAHDALPDFLLPARHPAREAGVDLSRPFTIDGVDYDPLPGMETGYFHGKRPDMGAVQQ